jgi:hypothetical protein
MKDYLNGPLIDSNISEMEIFSEAIENNDPTQAKNYKKKYDDAYQNIKQIAVPKNLAEFHKGILGIFWKISNIYEAVIGFQDDPLKTAAAITAYQNLTEEIKNIFAILGRETNKLN